MTDTTPAAELRAAATKLRALASKATSGICPDWIYSAVRHVARNCNMDCSHDEHQGWDQPEWDRYEDSPYIAAMGPAVGLALADWLDGTAATIEAVLRKHEDAATETSHWVAPALAVARALNGGQS